MQILKYPVRPIPILRYFGELCTALAVLTLVPFLVSLFMADWATAIRYAIVASGVMALGLLLIRLPRSKQIQANEAMVVTVMIFVFTPLVLTWPTMLPGLSFSNALFESISAITTTGLTTLNDVSGKPVTFLFARAWSQWVGGLGIVALSLAVMIQPGAAAKRLGDLEGYETDPVGGTRAVIRRVFFTYAMITAAGIVLLGCLGSGWFNAVIYTFAAVSTGGFSPHNASLADMPGHWTPVWVTLISIAGATPLLLYQRLRNKGWQAVVRDSQILTFLVAGLIFSFLLSATLWSQSGLVWPRAVYHGVLNAFSAQSTSGFSTLNISGIDAASKLILMISMSMGGCAGSTAGGIKILRLLIALRILQLIVLRPGIPQNAVVRAQLDGRRLENSEIQNALCLVLAFFICIVLSWFPFVFMGYDPMNALFEVVSALGTAGLTAGISGPMLHPFLKGVLCMDMFLGRLEIFAWLVLFSPPTWFGKRMRE